jgi:phosphoglycolate phosphatase-like HAD superfamily hydrolase
LAYCLSSDQSELRTSFVKRGVAEWFNGGIFGSPQSKLEILKREIGVGNIPQPALYFGDSKYDYLTASSAGLKFVFFE